MATTKPGFKTSEFWMTIFAGAGITALGDFTHDIGTAGAPSWVNLIVKLVGPLAITYLTKVYNDGRVAMKSASAASAAEAAVEAVPDLAAAVEVLKGNK